MSALADPAWASLPVPGFVVDGDDRIAEANPSAESFLNASARQLRGEPILERLAVDAPLEDAFSRVRATLSPLLVSSVDAGGGDAAPVASDIRLGPLAGAPGHVLLVIEPRPMSGRLDRARSATSAARSVIGMADMLAHEIKNPLAGITGAAQLLSMNLGPEDRNLADLIVAESRRIVALLDQVGEFGNLRPPERAPVNIHDILDRARKSALLGFAAGMRIEDEYDPSLPPARADADQMVQVFQGLIRNAAEAAEGGRGTIRIRTRFDGSLRMRRRDGSGGAPPLKVEVIDDGPGLPPEIAASVFDPFVSGKEPGRGLGLALASRIVARHDGWIDVESAPGRTVFTVSLPAEAGGAAG